MRCPKCGYISFDHLEKCRKCNKDIEAISEGLYGSTYLNKPPTFLHLPSELQEDPSEQSEVLNDQSVDDMEEYVDEDLEIFIEEEDAEEEGEINFSEDEQNGSPSLEDEEADEDEEIEIDFSQFEDADEPEINLFDEKEIEQEAQQDQVEQQENSMTLEMPAELADISDLAPPAMTNREDEQPAGRFADSDADDLDLGDLDFDLGLDDLDESKTDSSGIPEEALLALDEIDFTETLAESSSGKSKKTGNMDMDMDLDFDLDLGGLSIHKDV